MMSALHIVVLVLVRWRRFARGHWWFVKWEAERLQLRAHPCLTARPAAVWGTQPWFRTRREQCLPITLLRHRRENELRWPCERGQRWLGNRLAVILQLRAHPWRVAAAAAPYWQPWLATRRGQCPPMMSVMHAALTRGAVRRQQYAWQPWRMR